MAEHSTAGAPDWATKAGSVWARRWRDTDRGLSGLAPHLLDAIRDHAPGGSFRAFDIGCGPGSTCIDVAEACPQAQITACDISCELANIARERTASLSNVRVVEGSAESVAEQEGPFDLLFSRHGVMFFADPVAAFGKFRAAATPGAAIVFSCFQAWEANPWASDLAAAAAGRAVPSPGREPSGFAFAEPGYVREIFEGSGWAMEEPRGVPFEYTAGGSAEEALDFLLEIGPAARLIQEMPEVDRPAAIDRMRAVLDRHAGGGAVTFPAAAWIYSARAPA